jgi:NAD(P)-dependent dehydrogenase (short-subunit alcohol dehydrogenase family)
MTRLLENKTAIVYGAGGGIGGGGARTFAREGAHVFLVGRTRDPLEEVAADIKAHGGKADVDVIDALDEKAVDEHVGRAVAKSGRVDVSFNLISRGDVQQIPLVDMTAADLMRAVSNGLESHFITARAAARQMIKQGSGAILHLNSGSARGTMPLMGSTDPADVERAIAGMSMLRRAPRVAQVADVAAFLASDRADAITGTIVNVTCGLLPG